MGVVARFADLLRPGPGLGYKPDPRDSRDVALSASPLALPDHLPELVSYRGVVPVLNQSGTNACVGHSVASGLELAMTLDGTKAERVSEWAIWYWARAAWGDELLNEGTYVREALKQVMTLGIPPERTWGRTPQYARPPHNKQPPFSCLRAAAKHRGVQGYYRITAGDTRGIQQALAAKRPVVFGIDVTNDFLKREGPSVVGHDSSGKVGGHAMLCVGYKQIDGQLCFEIQNSWGANWRDGGHVFMTDSKINYARDLWALDVVTSEVA